MNACVESALSVSLSPSVSPSVLVSVSLCVIVCVSVYVSVCMLVCVDVVVDVGTAPVHDTNTVVVVCALSDTNVMGFGEIETKPRRDDTCKAICMWSASGTYVCWCMCVCV